MNIPCIVRSRHADDRSDFVGTPRSVNTLAILRNVLPDAVAPTTRWLCTGWRPPLANRRTDVAGSRPVLIALIHRAAVDQPTARQPSASAYPRWHGAGSAFRDETCQPPIVELRRHVSNESISSTNYGLGYGITASSGVKTLRVASICENGDS